MRVYPRRLLTIAGWNATADGLRLDDYCKIDHYKITNQHRYETRGVIWVARVLAVFLTILVQGQAKRAQDPAAEGRVALTDVGRRSHAFWKKWLNVPFSLNLARYRPPGLSSTLSYTVEYLPLIQVA